MQNPSEPTILQPATQTVEDSADYLANIIGSPNLAGQRIQAGPVLKMMYDTAVSVGMRHAGRRTVLLGLDRMDLPRRVCHMDLVRLEGKLIEVGRSSMVIEIKSYSKPPTEREFNPTHVGFVKMVAVDEQGFPMRDIPSLSYESPLGIESRALAGHRLAQINERKAALEWIDNKKSFQLSDIQDPGMESRYEFLRPEETEVKVKGQVISQAAREDGRVRGGDFLVWLDSIATYTAQQFTRNEHVITLSINDILFTHPLHNSDRIELTARVIYVRTHTLEISIDIVVHTMSGEQHALEPVDFLILNYNPSGMKRKITTGLKLEDGDQESIRRYLRAHTRHAFWKSNPESHLTQTPF